MANPQSPARIILNQVIAEAVTPITKTAGFRKTALNFFRRRGEVVQGIDFQLSSGSTWSEKEFYVNIGLAFDSLCHLAKVPVLEKPKAYYCDERGIRGRLGQFVQSAPVSWIVRVNQDPGPVTNRLHQCVTAVVQEMDKIDSIQTFADHPWFNRFIPTDERAAVLHLLGDLDSALREVHALAAFFHDRQNAYRAEWWVEHLHLDGLASAVK